jgi:murein L,D-transpeptidase YcbB/YkuD
LRPARTGPGRPGSAILPWLFLLGLASPASLDGQDTVATAIDELIGAARAPWARWPDFARYVDDLNRLYRTQPGVTVWLDGPRVTSQAGAAIGALRAAGEHGLDPRDYDAELLDRVARQSVRVPLAAVDRARFDVLLSVNLIRLLDDLRSGRLHRGPLLSTGETGVPLDLAAAVKETLAADSLPRLIAALVPHLAQYRNLQRLLARYRQLTRDTSISGIPATRTVRPGDAYSHVADLRRLLVAVGDLASQSAPDMAGVYAGAEVEAVRRFQSRHGLEPSGVLDTATMADLNTPFARRVRQIELALERLRWLPPIRRQPFVVVNIPAFQLFAFDSAGGTGAPALAMKVIVGKALDKQTPVLFEQMRYVEFRPAWNVPRSILLEELMPLLLRDPGYLGRNDMELVGSRDRVVGSVVTSELLDQLNRGELRVRQRPGGGNPLGSTKFVFPNAANVYLHGTPRAELFALTRRDFSHGCIRLEDPTALAVWVLRDQPRWARDTIVASQRGTTTTRALLTRPMPVVIFYTTAVATPEGRAWFFRDIYGHDQVLDEALRAGPTSP